MNRQPVRPPRVAPRRLTSASLTAGVILAATCFLVAGAAEFLGADSSVADMTDMTDMGALVGGLVALDPWAWASLGTYLVVATPALGLAVTAYEYATVADRHAVALALVVLTVLTLSTVVALLR